MSRIETKPFAEEGKAAVHGLRRAFAEMLASVGADPSEPQEVARRFGIDKTLAWRISRVVGEDDAWEVVQHIPKQPSVKLFVNALLKHGADRNTAEEIWKALAEFEDFVRVHSGDRETLEIMASGTGHRSALKKLETFRKLGFQANSALWGVQARVQLGLSLLTPSASSGHLDLTTVSGMIGLRRLRPNVPWTIATETRWDYDRHPGGGPVSNTEPLDPTVKRGDIPTIARFCGAQVPNMRTVEQPVGTLRYMLCEGDVGNTAAATVIVGWVHRVAAPIHESYPGECGEHGITLSTPVEEVVRDLYIHRDFAFAFNPTAHVYSLLPGGPQYPAAGESAPLLPVPTDVTDLGASPPDTTTPGAPRYREMVEFATAQCGYTLNDFRAFRYRLKYPPIPSMLVLRHALLPMQAGTNGTKPH